jgi:phospholipid-binding lipoprotein MlaA
MRTMRASTVVLAAALAVGGCATVQTPSKQDPLEGFNRTMFQVNDTLDRYAMKPVAQAYNWALPQFVRDRVSSFFSNVGDVYVAANNLLQGKITDGTEDIMRVAINSTFGLGGLFDFASQARLPKHQGDFGLTLGHYGVPAGPYLVLPLLGPSTVRDTAGLVVDLEVGDLLTYMRPIWLRTTLYGVRIVSTRAAFLGTTDLLAAAALDKYSFVRNAYLQRRQYLITGGQTPPPTYQDDSGADTGPTDMTPASGASAAGAPGAAAPAAGAAGAGAAGGVAGPGGAQPPTGASAPAANAPGAAAQGAQPASGAEPVQPASGAEGAQAASGAAAQPAAPASAGQPASSPGETTVPGHQMMPPGRYYNFPNLHLR